MWIPSHIDIESNRLADKNAKTAITIIENPTINEVTYEDIKKCIENIIVENASLIGIPKLQNLMRLKILP